MYCVQYNNSNN